MALRNIVLEGDPILRKKTREVESVDDRTRMILDDMLETMRAYDGVGIAAPQIGILRRMFIVEVEPGYVYFVVNPVMTETEGTQKWEEGCLSVPGTIGPVERPYRVKIESLDRDGNPQTIEAEDFLAVAMCHEYDHLDGILYIDKADEVYDADQAEQGEENK